MIKHILEVDFFQEEENYKSKASPTPTEAMQYRQDCVICSIDVPESKTISIFDRKKTTERKQAENLLCNLSKSI